MMTQEILIPVYFSPFNEELDNIINDVSHNANADEASKKKRDSAIAEIFNSVSANGYQVEFFFKFTFKGLVISFIIHRL